MDLSRIIKYIRTNLDEISVRNLAFIIRGLAFVFSEQRKKLETAGIDLLKEVRGDVAYQRFMKNNAANSEKKKRKP